MALEYDIVRITADTSRTVGTTFDVTSSRITDFSCCIIIPIRFFGGALGTAQADAGVGWGAADEFGSGGCMSRGAEDAANVSTCATVASGAIGGARALVVSDGNNVQLWACTAVARTTSGVANGIRLSTAVQATQAFEAIVILFGGIDASVFPLADSTMPSLPLSFTPNALVQANNNGTMSSAGTGNNDYMPNFGIAVDDAGGPSGRPTQVSIAGLWNDAQATSDADMILQPELFGAEVTGTGTVSVTHRIEASGFGTQITCSTPTGSSPVGWCLAMRFPTDGVRFGCAVVPFSGSAGVQTFTPFANFTPSLVVGQACLLTTTTTLQSDTALASVEGLFAFQAGTSYAAATRQDYAKTDPMAASTNFDDSALLLMDDTGATVVDASLVGFGGGGFQLNFASAQAGNMIVLAIGTFGSTVSKRAARAERRRRPVRRGQRGFVQTKAAAGSSLTPAFWREVVRQRRAAHARLMRRPAPPAVQAPGPYIEVEEDAGGRLSAPGVARGRLSAAEADGRLSSSGAARGRLTTSSMATRSEDDPL